MSAIANRRWHMLAVYSALMCLAMNLPIYGGSVIITRMAGALGWRSETVGTLMAINMVAVAVFMPLGARAVQSGRSSAAIRVGFAMMACGGLALALLPGNPWQVGIAFSVAMGITSAVAGLVPCQSGVAAWFSKDRMFAFSALYGTVGILSFGVIELINRSMAYSGEWRTGWGVTTIFALIAIAMTMMIRRPPPQVALETGQAGPEALAAFPHVEFASAVRQPLFLAVCFTMCALTAGSMFVVSHVQIYFVERGFDAATAATAISLMSIGMVAGNIGFGVLTRWIPILRVYSTGLVILGLALASLYVVWAAPALVAFALAAGIGIGAGQVGAMAMLAQFWKESVFPMLTAVAVAAQTIIGALAPVFAGQFHDRTGDYGVVVNVLIVVLALAVAMLGLAGRTLPERPFENA